MTTFTAKQLEELQTLGSVTVGGKTYESADGRFYVNTKAKTASDSYTEGAYSTEGGILTFDYGANTVTLTGEYIKDWGTGERVTYVTATASIEAYYSTGLLQLV